MLAYVITLSMTPKLLPQKMRFGVSSEEEQFNHLALKQQTVNNGCWKYGLRTMSLLVRCLQLGYVPEMQSNLCSSWTCHESITPLGVKAIVMHRVIHLGSLSCYWMTSHIYCFGYKKLGRDLEGLCFIQVKSQCAINIEGVESPLISVCMWLWEKKTSR